MPSGVRCNGGFRWAEVSEMFPNPATFASSPKKELQEQAPGLFVDIGALREILDLERRRWYSSLTEFRVRNYASYLGRKRSYGVLISPLSIRGYLFPHQLATTHRVLRYMGARALLADEVGLGKTVEAGMIMKELLLRHEIQRILILVPASLTRQWQEEMRFRFHEEFVVYDGRLRAELERYAGGKNIWALRDRIIASIGVAKLQPHRKLIQQVPWDLVIVDEAHHLRNPGTLNHKLVAGLQTRYLLFLTATPLQNSLLELYHLVHLLNPELLGSRQGFRRRFEEGLQNPESLEELRRRLRRVMVRNRRTDVGKFLHASRRQAITVRVPLDAENRALYDAVTAYALEGYRKSVANKNATYAFFTMLVQRMLTSSVEALAETLERRIQALEEIEKRGRSKKFVQHLLSALPEDEVERVPDRDFFPLRQVKAEIRQLRDLLRLARSVRTHPKLEFLRRVLQEVLNGEEEEKVVIFTEFRGTQDFLARALRGMGYEVVTFHGGMSAEERNEAVERFQKSAQILVSTEAGGEGQNLQFAHIVVNYDLPWNPMKVEQRIGRVHRIGQERDVLIYNLVTEDTIEEYVLHLLDHKIGLFRDVLGDLDAILGIIAPEGNFEQTLMEALSEVYGREGGSLKEAVLRLGDRIEEARKQAASSLSQVLSEGRLSLNLKADFPKYENYSVGPEERHIARFVREYLDRFNAVREVDAEEIRFVVPGHLSRDRLRAYTIRGTTSREVALKKPYLDFVSLGHPFLDAAIEDSQTRLPLTVGLLREEVLKRLGVETRQKRGILATFIVRYRIGTVEEDHTFLVLATEDGAWTFKDLREELLYLQEIPPFPMAEGQFERLVNRALRTLREELIKHQQELFREQKRELEEMKHYVERYYEDLAEDARRQLNRIAHELLMLRKRRARSPEMDLDEATREEQRLLRERRNLMVTVLNIQKQKKQKLAEMDDRQGVRLQVRLLSVAKLLIF